MSFPFYSILSKMLGSSAPLEGFLVRLTGMQNYSLLTVPVAWLLCAMPLIYAIHLTRGNYTQADPRTVSTDTLDQGERTVCYGHASASLLKPRLTLLRLRPSLLPSQSTLL